MDKNELTMLEQIKQARFRKNNGRVLRGLNILRTKYVFLDDLKSGLSSDITDSEYHDCVNYLCEIGFIHLRNKKTKQESTLADTELASLEGKLSADGIRFVNGKKDDPCIEL